MLVMARYARASLQRTLGGLRGVAWTRGGWCSGSPRPRAADEYPQPYVDAP